MEYREGQFDAVVVGAGHAGCEAALALARTGQKTLMLTLNPDSIAFMACNPSIGGTAKGHLVREIDALGGEMGVNADATLLQLKMLNVGKGAAVQSLRAQADKNLYHTRMKQVLERTENLTMRQGECARIIVENGEVCGVVTSMGIRFDCRAVVLCTGVYLKSDIIIGEYRTPSGPSGFAPSNELTANLMELGFSVRRFKTGTPARVHKRSLDFSKMQVEMGAENVFPFSFLTEGAPRRNEPCFLTYTNAQTHEVIRSNLSRSPLFGGSIRGVGPRYCPSIEDKVVRFPDKERHQIFIEPEGEDTDEMYVQGMSSSLPADVQLAMYRTVAGMENVEIIRNAYAIEYDCIDPQDLDASLQFKKIKGLFSAGQINGSSGYEEAAAQGLVAGLNASLQLRGKPLFYPDRAQSYIGVLIDDLVTKGTNEPYRMMTARAEHRLHLRQDNADLRLTPLGREMGLVSDVRWEKFNAACEELKSARSHLSDRIKPDERLKTYFETIGESFPVHGLSVEELLRRTNVRVEEAAKELGILQEFTPLTRARIETEAKYAGYLDKEEQAIARARKLEEKEIPVDFNFEISGLRLEARQKLAMIKPRNLGQASRISGVSPADVAVLMVALAKEERK